MTTEIKDQQNQASNILLSSLSDQKLREIRAVVGKHKEMLENVDLRYESKTTISKIAKMSEIISIWSKSVCNDMEKNLDHIDALIELVRSMRTTLLESLAIGFLVASVDFTQLLPITALLRRWKNPTSNGKT